MKVNIDLRKPPKNLIGFYRTYYGLSQQKLTEMVNAICGTDYRQKSMSRWELGSSFVPCNVLMALALIFDKNMEHLMGMASSDTLMPLMPEFEKIKSEIQFEE